MHSSTLLVTLAVGAMAAVHERAASDPAGFSTAASALIASYIPPSIFSQVSASVASAAGAASVTGDASSLLYSALEAPTPPAWLSSAIPSSLTGNFAALESGIASLRPANPGGPASTAATQTTVLVQTTTDSAGSTITTSLTTAVPSGSGTSTAGGSGSSTGANKTATTTTTSSSHNAAAPTAAARHVAGGVVALVGLAIAL